VKAKIFDMTIIQGKFTGEVDETGYIGVQTLDETLFARPMMQAPFIGIPDKNWVDTYGDNYFALISYIDDSYERPVLLGIIPKSKPTFPDEGYDKYYYFLSAKFRLVLDDDNNECIIDVLDGGTVKLGDKDVTESGVLGDKNAQVLIDLANGIVDIVTALTTSAITPIDGGASFKASMASLSSVLSKAQQIAATKANETKSNTVKLK